MPVYLQNNILNFNSTINTANTNTKTNTGNIMTNSGVNPNSNNNKNTNANSGITVKLPVDSRVSTVYKGESLANYLKTSPNCQSNDPQ